MLLASHSTGASGIFILGYSASLLEKWNCGGFPIRENNYVQVEGTALGSEGIFRLLRPPELRTPKEEAGNGEGNLKMILALKEGLFPRHHTMKMQMRCPLGFGQGLYDCTWWRGYHC